MQEIQTESMQTNKDGNSVDVTTRNAEFSENKPIVWDFN